MLTTLIAKGNEKLLNNWKQNADPQCQYKMSGYKYVKLPLANPIIDTLLRPF